MFFCKIPPITEQLNKLILEAKVISNARNGYNGTLSCDFGFLFTANSALESPYYNSLKLWERHDATLHIYHCSCAVEVLVHVSSLIFILYKII